MNRFRVLARIDDLRRRLTLDGRLKLVQPLAPLAAFLTLILAIVLPARWLLYIGYTYALLTLAAYCWVRILGNRLTLQRRLEADWAQVGDELEEHWAIENRSALPLLWAEIDDESTLPEYHARRVVAAESGERVTWRTLARCERCGVYRLGPLTARIGDPLGLFQFAWRQGSTRELTIYPPLVRLPPWPLPHGARGGLAQADLLQINVTPNVAGVRAYVPGDPPSRVHWPYLARFGELYVKEFDQEQAGALWIVLDLAAAAYVAPEIAPPLDAAESAAGQSSVVGALADVTRPATLADLAVTLAASLAAQMLAEGRSVGLLCDDGRRRVLRPAGGTRQLWLILNALVDCMPTGERPLAELLRGGSSGREGALRGAAIAVVTADLGAAWLPALLERQSGRAGG
ncbi:MAG: DUF58 domain-containing protein, partial [Oscillochloris sp.]|nr:DUF58 domain-containing protein [Oscillochloris sp.]